jgi:tetratricopeptide (TPR) repeat protein
MKDLKGYLQAGIPILVLQDMSLSDKRGHFRVVIGYSDITRMVFVRDSNYEDVRSIPYDEFDKTWSSYSRWALVVCPKEKEDLLDASVRDNPVLHLDLGQAYLRLKQPERAREQFEEALRMEPENEEAKDRLAQLVSRGHRSS